MARKPIKYEFTADADDFKRGAEQAERALRGIERQAKDTEDALNLRPEVDDSALGVLRRRLLAVKAQLEDDIRINPEVDAVQALADLRRVERQLRQLDRMDVRPEVNIDRDGGLSRFTRDVLPALSRALPEVARDMGSIAVAAPEAVAGVAGIAAALVGPSMIAGTAALEGLVAVIAAKGGYSLLTAYDQIEKANKRFDTVFGDQADTIAKWAKDLGFATGSGTQAVKDQAAAVQDLLVPRGFSRGKAANITESILDRAAALAEWAGVDIGTASSAVTSALLGEREQLKGLGIDIGQTEVNRRKALLRSKDAYKGMNDSQLEVVATQQLIEEKSVDAWTAWTNGTDDAGDALDRFNAALANIKTDAIKGFGGVFADVVTAIVGGAEDLEKIDLAKWIKDNRDAIYDAMLEIVAVSASGVQAMGTFAITVGNAVGPMLELAQAALAFARGWSYVQQAALGPLNLLPGVRDFFTGFRQGIDGTYADIEGLGTAWDSTWSLARPGLEALITKAQELGTTVEDLQSAKQWVIAARVEVKEHGMKEVKADLEHLTEPQLAAIIATTEGSDSKVDQKLNKAAKKRLAEIKAETKNQTSVNNTLNWVARDRTATVTVKYTKPKYGYGTNNPSIGGALPGQGNGQQGLLYYPVPQTSIGRMSAGGVIAAPGVALVADTGGMTVNFYGPVTNPDATARELEKVYRDHRRRVG